MRKVLSFSLFLMLGLIVSQLLPGTLGAGYAAFKKCSDTLLYICLGFIMINVGREFEIDKTRWRSYTADYFIAMATAALPWILIVLYYVFVLLPPELWTSGEAWKENLLLSRFAAPTSAGILFTMLAALSLKKSWIYKKIQVLAIFDDLDTILLMIPLIFIGVVLGLAVTGKVFNFFSLLGLLGLVGMNIKNAVVLVEQIGVLRAGAEGLTMRWSPPRAAVSCPWRWLREPRSSACCPCCSTRCSEQWLRRSWADCWSPRC